MLSYATISSINKLSIRSNQTRPNYSEIYLLDNTQELDFIEENYSNNSYTSVSNLISGSTIPESYNTFQ